LLVGNDWERKNYAKYNSYYGSDKHNIECASGSGVWPNWCGLCDCFFYGNVEYLGYGVSKKTFRLLDAWI